MSTPESDDDPILITLSTRPGSDLASKMLFHEAEIKDIVINEVTAQKEFKDGRKSDVVYGIKGGKYTEAIPPVLVEIQQKVDISFLKRLTRYCLNIHDLTKLEPAVIVFVIQGFSSKAFIEDNFNQPQNESYHTSKQYLWAKTCRFYCIDSISANMMNGNAMTPMVALTYFLCSQKKSLFGLEESGDPELRRIYQIAARSFEPYTTKEEGHYNHMMELMENTKNQFQKISKCADELEKSEDNDTILKKIKRYAEDGYDYTNKKIKMVEDDEAVTITPIEKQITETFISQSINGKNQENFYGMRVIAKEEVKICSNATGPPYH